MRSFKSLSEQEVLALAISLEEEDARIYDDFADGLKETYPALAERCRALRAEEDPDRLSFLHAVRVVRRKLPLFAALSPSGQARPA